MNMITKKDQLLLLTIAEYKILMIDQIALLNHTGKGIVQRKVSRLFKDSLVSLSPRNSLTNIGRLENIISISEKGVQILQKGNLIDNKIPIERCIINKGYNIEHELLLNWFRVHLLILVFLIDVNYSK